LAVGCGQQALAAWPLVVAPCGLAAAVHSCGTVATTGGWPPLAGGLAAAGCPLTGGPWLQPIVALQGGYGYSRLPPCRWPAAPARGLAIVAQLGSLIRAKVAQFGTGYCRAGGSITGDVVGGAIGGRPNDARDISIDLVLSLVQLKLRGNVGPRSNCQYRDVIRIAAATAYEMGSSLGGGTKGGGELTVVTNAQGYYLVWRRILADKMREEERQLVDMSDGAIHNVVEAHLRHVSIGVEVFMGGDELVGVLLFEGGEWQASETSGNMEGKAT
ncbi:hypothetical protein B296_00050393, partial [Ensete ventricosum]